MKRAFTPWYAGGTMPRVDLSTGMKSEALTAVMAGDLWRIA